MIFLQVCVQHSGAASRVITRAFIALSQSPVGAWYLRASSQQRCVSVFEDRDVRDGESPQGFSVITAGETHEFGLVRSSEISPVMKAHLERDFDGRCAVAAVEAVPELAAGAI